jgi:hypothetical protein
MGAKNFKTQVYRDIYADSLVEASKTAILKVNKPNIPIQVSMILANIVK